MDTIVLKNLSIGYVTKGQRRVVAKEMNASLRSGEMTCLLGRNGVGKSTLLRTLSAFQPAIEGDINIAVGTHYSSLATLTDQQRSRLIGIVLTEKPDVRNMTTEEMVGMGRSPYTGFWGTLKDEDRQIVDHTIQLTGIEALRGRMIQTLSDGERQKVMIAKALAQQTPVIFLDEPTAFLDFPSKVEMMQLLNRLAREEQKTIFFSTHDVELAIGLADRIWLMESDSLSIGTPRELADQGALHRFIERDGIRFNQQTLTIEILSKQR